MTLEQGYFITQIAAGVILVASVIFLAIQVRQNTTMLNQMVREEFRVASNSLFEEVAKNPEFAHLHKKIGDSYESLNDLDKHRATFIARKTVRNLVHSIQAKLHGNLTDEQWGKTQYDIVSASRRPHVKAEWNSVKHIYSQNVQDLWNESAST